MMYPMIEYKPKGAWNKGRLMGQKRPFRSQEIWAIRERLQIEGQVRDLALFNLGLDSKLRGCDLVALKVADVTLNSHVVSRAIVMQSRTGSPVRFEITRHTREAVAAWIRAAHLAPSDYLFPSRVGSRHLSTRQYARIVASWAEAIGLDRSQYGTHSLRRTKATLIYRRTKNLRAVQLLLGHTRIESTIRYLGIEIDDALEIAEQVEI